MKAKNDRVICRLGIMPERLKSGLFLPDQVQKDGQAKINIGKVVKFGQGFRLPSGEFVQGYDGQEGDVICWEQFGGILYELVEKGLVCIRNSDIGCVLEPHEYKGWEFDQKVVDEINQKNHDEIRAAQQKILDKPREISKQTFQCWNNDCKAKLNDVETAVLDPVCEYCGKPMSLKQVAALGVVH